MVVAKHVANHRLLWLQLDGGLHSVSVFVQFDLDNNLKATRKRSIVSDPVL